MCGDDGHLRAPLHLKLSAWTSIGAFAVNVLVGMVVSGGIEPAAMLLIALYVGLTSFGIVGTDGNCSCEVPNEQQGLERRQNKCLLIAYMVWAIAVSCILGFYLAIIAVVGMATMGSR